MFIGEPFDGAPLRLAARSLRSGHRLFAPTDGSFEDRRL
ncbi:hypothetical protein FHT02_002671 [Sphingomonas xinjiangensis]|uniref:Uncharacterized protein n=1 Tax=Sphingomonas xinjiangensis TaxID=643568 RepID=A0A840YDF4_9SPHN|nr:hypothetical protein [Sphingomonas xinjiangensis]